MSAEDNEYSGQRRRNPAVLRLGREPRQTERKSSATVLRLGQNSSPFMNSLEGCEPNGNNYSDDPSFGTSDTIREGTSTDGDQTESLKRRSHRISATSSISTSSTSISTSVSTSSRTSSSTSSTPSDTSAVPTFVYSLKARSPLEAIKISLLLRLQGGHAEHDRSVSCRAGGGGGGGCELGDKQKTFGLSGITPYFPQTDIWSSGYRNLQMLLGALVILNQDKLTIDRVDHGEAEESLDCLPDLTALLMDDQGKFGKLSVNDLQLLLQRAWDDGFDSKGKVLYSGVPLEPKGVFETTKWIGVIEVWAILSNMGLSCKIVDFEVQEGSVAGDRVMRWLSQYFLDEAVPEHEVCESRSFGLAWMAAAGMKPPIYLQDDSFSKTIVGVARDSLNSLYVIMLDPAKHVRTDSIKQGSYLVSADDMRVHGQYQLLHVLPGYRQKNERDASMKDPDRDVWKK
mmetsp:Transcript_44436/g.89757  ORF Transcript_44436/g.89757 Transcript_44436/m.89757 type:complete len:456 (-) Transcript_44436:43-1410(-)